MTTQTLPNTSHLDREFLQSWIQPQCLTDEAIQKARDSFQNHPAHIARISSFLHEDMAAKLAALLGDEVDYTRIRHLYSQDNRNVSEDEFVAASEDDRLGQFAHMSQLKPKEGVKPGLNLLFYMKFQKFFFDARFAQYMRLVTGLDLVAPTTFVVNTLSVGDFIASHNDVHRDRHHRRIAFILYLTPGWKPEFGGALHTTGHGGDESVFEVEYNSFAFFDVMGHRTHEVKPVLEAAAPRRRTSFNGWWSETPPVP